MSGLYEATVKPRGGPLQVHSPDKGGCDAKTFSPAGFVQPGGMEDARAGPCDEQFWPVKRGSPELASRHYILGICRWGSTTRVVVRRNFGGVGDRLKG